jgi:hypothetical protein
VILTLATALLIAASPHPRLSGDWEGKERDVSVEAERKSADVVIRNIARQAGWSVVMGEGAKAEVSLHLRDVPADLALGAVLDAAELVADRRGPVITVKRGASSEQKVVVVQTGDAPELPEPPSLPHLPQPPELAAAESRLIEEAARLEVEAAQLKDEEKRSDLQERANDLREKASELREKMAELREKEAELREKEAEVRAKFRYGRRSREDRVMFGQNVTIRAGEEVNDAVAFAGNLTVEPGGVVRGDAAAFGGNLVVQDGAEVRGGVAVFGGNLDIAPTAVVRGDRTVFSGAEFVKEMVKPRAVVEAFRGEPEGWSWGGFGRWLLAFVGFFALSFLVRMLWAERVRTATSVLLANPGRTALAGFIGAIAVIPLTVVLVVTLIGIPLIPLFLLGVVAATFFGMVVLASYVGDQIPMGKFKSPAAGLAAGVLAMLLVSLIPVLGPVTLWVASVIALGVSVSSRVGQPQRSENPPADPGPGLDEPGAPVAP